MLACILSAHMDVWAREGKGFNPFVEILGVVRLGMNLI